MGNTNTLPVVSQTKSLVQFATGDSKGARETQEKFLHECPIVAQATSLVELAVNKDKEQFVDTNKRSVKTLSNFTDGIPIVGHVKGAIHAATGDKEAAKHSVKSANRSTGVVSGGVVGFLAGGPVGAVAGGIAGGAAVDGIHTGVDFVRHNEFRANGSIAAVKQAIEQPSGGTVFDAIAVPLFDGVAGYGAGQVTAQIQTGIANAQLVEAMAQRDAAIAALEEGAEVGGVNTGAESGSAGFHNDINHLSDNIGNHKIAKHIAKEVLDPKSGGVDIPKAKLKAGAAKYGVATTTTATASNVQMEQIIQQLGLVQKLLSETGSLSGAAYKVMVDSFLKDYPAAVRVLFSQILHYIGSSIQRRKEAQQKTADLIEELKKKKDGQFAKANEEAKEDRTKCVFWDMKGISDNLLDHGCTWYLLLDKPDVIVLSGAQEQVIQGLTTILGYEQIHFVPSESTAPHSPCVVLYKETPALSLVGGGSDEELKKATMLQLSWIDMESRTRRFRIMICKGDDEIASEKMNEVMVSVRNEAEKHSCVIVCDNSSVAGADWNDMKVVRFNDTHNVLMVKQVSSADFLFHQPCDPIPNAAAPLLFAIGANVNPSGEICSDDQCYYNCSRKL